MKTDTQIQLDVQAELQHEPTIHAAGIEVTAKDGIVTLSGTVTSQIEKASAIRATERVSGVKGVVDELEVSLPGSHLDTDEEIAHAVLNALKRNVSILDERIKVGVENGCITLEGTVDHKYQEIAAIDAVRNLTGVKGITKITNLIVVAPVATMEEIKTKIENAFRRSAELDAQRIKIDLHDGRVTLRGTVHSWAERDEAERAARSAPGVAQVIDKLIVIA